MAKQSGMLRITGTIDNLCFYKMDGQYYVRMKSSLTGKRVKKDPAFSATMRYAGFLADAARIASAVYRKVNADQQVKGLYRKITGEAMRLLKEDQTIADVTGLLEAKYVKTAAAPKAQKSEKPVNKVISFAEAVLERVFTATATAAAPSIPCRLPAPAPT
ncbi:MAG TPA: hypothetical protein PKM63_03875 [Panacibacter sp.]|nr:hypothetical protein [Panacibacter sp.]HNP43396.1 hypothetical protein [Panacibacter sp.]